MLQEENSRQAVAAADEAQQLLASVTEQHHLDEMRIKRGSNQKLEQLEQLERCDKATGTFNSLDNCIRAEIGSKSLVGSTVRCVRQSKIK